MQLTTTCEPAVARLPGGDPVHARGARRNARVLLAAWGLGEHASLGELIISELAANAVCHGETPIWMRLSVCIDDLRVEVHDGGAGRPVRKRVGRDEECGRGLELLDGLIELYGGERDVINDQAGPGKIVYVVLSLETHRQVHDEVRTRHQDTYRAKQRHRQRAARQRQQPAPAPHARGGCAREGCPHAPPCPPPRAPVGQTALVIASHPEQGWSLLCNGVVVFHDTGALLPDGFVIEPGPTTCQPGITGTRRAGHARTVVPVPAGRAGKQGCAGQVPPGSAQPSPRGHQRAELTTAAGQNRMSISRARMVPELFELHA